MRTISGICIALATALVLSACAGTGPQNPSDTPSASAPPAPQATANTGSTRLPKGMRRVTRDGQEYICRRETSTASRTEIVETCLTAAEFEERTKKGQGFLQGLQDSTLAAPAPSGKTFTPGF